MPRVKIVKSKDGSLSVERDLFEVSGDGIAVRLIKRAELKKGVRVRVTQSADGKRFKGEIVEDEE